MVNNFGQVNDVRNTIDVETLANVAFKYLGGKFVTSGAAQRVGLTIDSETKILGWAEVGEFTTDSTAGNDKVTVNIARDAVYEMPIDAVRTKVQLEALIGKTCDIIVANGIQYADYDAGDDNVLQIVGYHYYGSGSREQTLLVRLFDNNITANSVT